jgi:hypothetical protein
MKRVVIADNSDTIVFYKRIDSLLFERATRRSSAVIWVRTNVKLLGRRRWRESWES